MAEKGPKLSKNHDLQETDNFSRNGTRSPRRSHPRSQGLTADSVGCEALGPRMYVHSDQPRSQAFKYVLVSYLIPINQSYP